MGQNKTNIHSTINLVTFLKINHLGSKSSKSWPKVAPRAQLTNVHLCRDFLLVVPKSRTDRIWR